MTTETQPLHIIRLTVNNFMQVKALQVDADGRHIVVTGANGAGKSSLLGSVWAALKGVSTKQVPEPIHKGADRASVFLDIGEYRIERKWTEKGTTLVVTAADGSRIAKPQQLLDGLLAIASLDPVKFMELREQDQVDQVLAVYGVSPPVDEVAGILGERIEPLPNESAWRYLERLFADETGLVYVQRRQAHRQVEQKRAALEEQRQSLASLGGPLRAEEGIASASQLLTEIESLQQKADQRRQVHEHAAEVGRELHTAKELLSKLDAEMDAESRETMRLLKELEKRKEHASALSARIGRGNEVIFDLRAECEAADEAAAKLPDPSQKILALRQQVASVEATNAKHGKRRLASGELDRLAREAESAEAEHAQLDRTIAAGRELRVHLLDDLDLGVPGLQVGDGGLRMNGVSFKQASQAERMRVSLAIAMRQKPRLRLIRIDEAEHLDRHSKEVVFRMAEENGFQVLMASVADQEGLRVEIVEH